MTLSELRTRVKNLTAGRNYMGVAEDSHLNAQINNALNYIGAMVPLYDVSVGVDLVTGSYSYHLADMDKMMVTIDTVRIDGEVLKGYTGKAGALYSFPELKAYYPNFTDSDNGKPEAACVYGLNLILSPAPDQVYDCTVSGRYHPSPLSSDNDEPDIPERLHECLAVMAALLAIYPVQGADDLLAKLKDEYTLCYEALKKEMDLGTGPMNFGFADQNSAGVI